MGATSTRSSSESWASRSASPIDTTPTCSPSGPTRRTSGTRIRSLMRGSVMASPLLLPVRSRARPGRRRERRPRERQLTGPVSPVARAPERARRDSRPTAGSRDPGTWSPGRRQVGAGSSWISGPEGRWMVRVPRCSREARPRYSAAARPGHSRVAHVSRRSVVVEQRRRRRLLGLRRGEQGPQPLDRPRPRARSSTAWTANSATSSPLRSTSDAHGDFRSKRDRAHRRPRQLVVQGDVAEPDARRRRRPPATGPSASRPAPSTRPSPKIATWSTAPKRTTPVDDDVQRERHEGHHHDDDGGGDARRAAACAGARPRPARAPAGGSVTRPWSQQPRRRRLAECGDVEITGTAQHEAWQAKALPPVEQLRAGPLVDPGADGRPAALRQRLRVRAGRRRPRAARHRLGAATRAGRR